ncbi:MAG: MBL fold metallo-hydrolase, partial [Bacteroidota bacterium]
MAQKQRSLLRRILRWTFIGLGSFILMVGVFLGVFFNFAPVVGGNPEGERLARIEASPLYKDGQFQNSVETMMEMSFSDMLGIMGEQLNPGPERSPAATIQTVPFDAKTWAEDTTDQLKVTWFGHSSLLVRLEGKTFLLDPVFGKRASMFSFMGPERFDYEYHVTVEDMPPLDGVIISHDHYDHLDYPTIDKLKDIVPHFYVPLGIGAHLERWGVQLDQISETEWWDEIVIHDSLSLINTPSRHFSGRGMTNRFSTLWSSWVIQGKKQRLYFSGDSGYFPGFKEIGDKYGPFDIALMECGAYNKLWSEIHLMPEESVQAAVDLQARVYLPVHWGKFDLALHPWKEPVQRMMKKAKSTGMKVQGPLVGQVVVVGTPVPEKVW